MWFQVILEETPEESPSPLGYGKRGNAAKGKDASESSYQDAEDSPEESGQKDPTPKPRRPVTRSKKTTEPSPVKPTAKALPGMTFLSLFPGYPLPHWKCILTGGAGPCHRFWVGLLWIGTSPRDAQS